VLIRGFENKEDCEMNLIELFKQYANAFKLAIVVIIIGAICLGWWYHGHVRYESGRADVQALWDVDKAQRKAAGDAQAAATLTKDKENEDALNKAKIAIHDTHNNLDIALNRLRDLPLVSGGEGLLMAGGGSPPVSGMANDTGRPSVTIEKRIGSCRTTGSDPCFNSRDFFDQAVRDASDRSLTRAWAVGLGIKTANR
jgi:hypothetical protein